MSDSECVCKAFFYSLVYVSRFFFLGGESDFFCVSWMPPYICIEKVDCINKTIIGFIKLSVSTTVLSWMPSSMLWGRASCMGKKYIYIHTYNWEDGSQVKKTNDL